MFMSAMVGLGHSRMTPVQVHANERSSPGILSGSSEVLMGVGTGDVVAGLDDKDGAVPSSEQGLRLVLRAGDVVVHPAGTAHTNLGGEDYQLLSFFPEVSTRTSRRIRLRS